MKYSLFKWAIGVGREVCGLREEGKNPGSWLASTGSPTR